MHYIGLDVHRRQIEVCILDADGKVLQRLDVAATRGALESFAQTWLKRDDKLALEATTNCWAIVEALLPWVGHVAVANPLTTKLIAQSRVKTDKVDALVLAQLLRTNFLPTVWSPDERTIRSRRLSHRRAALTGQATACKNRIHATLAMDLVEPFEADLFSPKGQAWLAGLDLAEDSRAAIQSEQRLLEGTTKEIALVEQRLAEMSYENADVKLLMTIPGIDFVIAFALISALGDIKRFKDGDHLASYLGLAPRTRQSGAHCYHGSITKAGNSHARWLLVQAAWTMVRQPGPLAAFFRKVAKRRGKNIAVVAVARKLAVIAWHMLTHNEPYRYGSPTSTATKLASLRIRATGQRRKSGTAKGQGRHPNYGTGQATKAVPGLPEVCRRESLPQPKTLDTLPDGELRMLKQTGVEALVRERHTDGRKPRAKKGLTSPIAKESKAS